MSGIKWITRDKNSGITYWNGEICIWGVRPNKCGQRYIAWIGDTSSLEHLSLKDFKRKHGFVLKPGEIRKVKVVTKLLEVKK